MKGLLFKKKGKTGLTVTVLVVFSFLLTMGPVMAQELSIIKLPAVNKNRGNSLMTALSNKASADSLSDRDLSLQDLSDLLWAAAGINRPDIKKRTFSTAMNTQDIGVYLLMKDGAYVYDYENHALNPVTSGDHRNAISLRMGGGGAPAGAPPGGAPAGAGQGGPPGEAAQAGGGGGAPEGSAGGPPAGAGARRGISTFAFSIILVSEPSQYRAGSDDLKKEWGAFAAGEVAQNIMLFCTANNLGTRPRAAFDKDTVKTLLKLRDTQNPVIEMPVGYPE